MKVFYIYKRISHHAAHSGYDQLPKYVPSSELSPRIGNYLAKVLEKIPEKKMEKWLMPQVGGWYKKELLAQEVQMAISVALRIPYRKAVYHYLYGEDAFRWGAFLPLKFRNRIAVSLHQPPDIFNEVIKDKSFVNNADAIIVCGSNQIDFFKQITNRDNVYFVPHGIDTDFFTPSSENAESAFNTMSVGWWLRDVEMIKRIATRASDLSLKIIFNIVTFPQYYDFYNGLSNVRLYAGISDDDLKSKYQQSDALLLPLKDSTANNAILEAMACGKPVLTTDVGGVRDYVDERCGYLAKRGDDQYLLDALSELMSNPGKKKKMGDAARAKAMEFDWRNVAKKMMNAYERILEM